MLINKNKINKNFLKINNLKELKIFFKKNFKSYQPGKNNKKVSKEL